MRFVPKSRLASSGDAPPFPTDQIDIGPLPEPSTPEQLATGPGAWSIVLASFHTESAATAAETLKRFQSIPGLERAYVELRGKAIVIAFGSYTSGSQDAAQRDLQRLRQLEFRGEHPFDSAVLSPPPFSGIAGTIPEYDLASVRQRYGAKALYTLQIAVYEAAPGKEPTPAELQEVRLSAEQAAVEFRREGELAFYYHGQRRSMVTLGVFGDDDYDVQHPEKEHPRLTILRQKYPYNLVNGATLLVRTRGQTKATEQPSFVVSIPN